MARVQAISLPKGGSWLETSGSCTASTAGYCGGVRRCPSLEAARRRGTCRAGDAGASGDSGDSGHSGDSGDTGWGQPRRANTAPEGRGDNGEAPGSSPRCQYGSACRAEEAGTAPARPHPVVGRGEKRHALLVGAAARRSLRRPDRRCSGTAASSSPSALRISQSRCSATCRAAPEATAPAAARRPSPCPSQRRPHRGSAPTPPRCSVSTAPRRRDGAAPEPLGSAPGGGSGAGCAAGSLPRLLPVTPRPRRASSALPRELRARCPAVMEGQNAASRHACLCKRVRIQTATARRGASRRCRLRVDRPSESQAEAGVFCRRRDAFQNTGAGSRELLRGHGAGTSRVSCTSSCCGTLRDFWEVPCGFLFVKPTQKFIVLLSWESSVSPGLRALSSQFLMLN